MKYLFRFLTVVLFDDPTDAGGTPDGCRITTARGNVDGDQENGSFTIKANTGGITTAASFMALKTAILYQIAIR